MNKIREAIDLLSQTRPDLAEEVGLLAYGSRLDHIQEIANLIERVILLSEHAPEKERLTSLSTLSEYIRNTVNYIYHNADLAKSTLGRVESKSSLKRKSVLETAELERLRKDAERYRWLRAGDYPISFARAVLNDSPSGIDAAIDAAIAKQEGE